MGCGAGADSPILGRRDTAGRASTVENVDTPEELFQRLTPRLQPQPNTPQRRRCSGIKRNGERCKAWAVTGKDQCAGHLKLVPLDSAVGVAGRRKAAEKRRLARMSVRDRLAYELDSDQEALVQALKDGIRLPDRKAAAQAAIRYVQLVYGSQLQRAADEEAFDDPLDVASMTIEQRDRLKRRLLAKYPHLVEEYRALASEDP
jgi:hypothetical protein